MCWLLHLLEYIEALPGRGILYVACRASPGREFGLGTAPRHSQRMMAAKGVGMIRVMFAWGAYEECIQLQLEHIKLRSSTLPTYMHLTDLVLVTAV